jgi:hypothetical protein
LKPETETGWWVVGCRRGLEEHLLLLARRIHPMPKDIGKEIQYNWWVHSPSVLLLITVNISTAGSEEFKPLP